MMKRRSFFKQTAMGTIALSSMNLLKAANYEPLKNRNSRQSGSSNNEDYIKVAVVQQDGNPGQVESNLAKALSFAEQALAQKADVILFHEELLVGYHKDLKALAEPVNGRSTQAFQKLLEGTNSLIIYGLTEKHNNDYYITAPVVSGQGLMTYYRKTHLWWDDEGLRHEPSYYRPGDRLVTFRIKGHLCGIMICYDGDFPEMTRSYANLGCSMLFWMNNRGSRGYGEVKDLARRNSMIMPVSCCCGTDERGNECRGGSNITGPEGDLIAEIWDKEGFIIAGVQPGKVDGIRKKNPWYTGLRPDLYQY
jgi:predicted amidohydrolase